jgi:hypothetical protein
MIAFEEKLAQEYAVLPRVEAVALGGSRTGPFAEPTSDYDLYVYSRSPVDLASRIAIARRHSAAPETDNRFWEAGDEWIETGGERVDVMFRDTGWMEEQLARVLDRHEASIGYSTAFWFNLKTSKPLFDRDGWFARIQQKASAAYPEALRRNIIAKNYPILRSTQSSYVHQIESAAQRKDAVSVNHRTTALLASFFDIVFAMNRQPHPGEKRLLQWSGALCPARPIQMETLIPEIISNASRSAPEMITVIHPLLDGLDDTLRAEGLI